MDVKHGNGLNFLPGIMQPGIDGIGFGMALEVKDLHDSIPNGLPVERLFHWDAFTVSRLPAMKCMNRFS